jgi:hypothetical protein
MVDPDCPNSEDRSFKTYLHWLVPNVQLNCETTRLNVSAANYIPPHPQQGSPYHRYTILLLQKPGGRKIDVDVQQYLSRRHEFDVRRFCSIHGLSLDKGTEGGGGVFMWREVWNETVSDIYEHTLSEFQILLVDRYLICPFFRNTRTSLWATTEIRHVQRSEGDAKVYLDLTTMYLHSYTSSANATTSLRGKMPICTSCATELPYLYTVYDTAYNLRLELCVCGRKWHPHYWF